MGFILSDSLLYFKDFITNPAKGMFNLCPIALFRAKPPFFAPALPPEAALQRQLHRHLRLIQKRNYDTIHTKAYRLF